MTQTKDVVKNFVGSPYKISGIKSGNTNYRNFVVLLHLLLVKYKKKKCFVFFTDMVGLNKPLKICKKLKLPWKKMEMGYMEEFTRSAMSDDLIGCIMEVSYLKSSWDTIVCSMDKSVIAKIMHQTQPGDSFRRFGHKQLASIEEYPKCCAVEFIDMEWEYIEICAEIVGKSEEEVALDPETEEWVERSELRQSWGYSAKLIAVAVFVWTSRFAIIHHNYLDTITSLVGFSKRNQELFDEFKVATLENKRNRDISFVKTMRKYPFLTHKACKSCLENTKNSPSAMKNKIYSDFCKHEFPELHDAIIGDVADAIVAFEKDAVS